MSKNTYAGVVIFGPTASGKTSLSIELAKEVGGEVINADSRQLYSDMTVLTAAPNKEEQGNVPHHLFEILSPKQKVSVTDYTDMAKRAVTDVIARGKVPIICGGTGFYLKVLREGISNIPDVCDELKEELRTQAEEFGNEKLLEELKQVDPVIAERLDAGNTQRIMRALGVYKQTGRALSYYQSLPPEGAISEKMLYVVLQPDRDWLNARIEKRFSLMGKAGVEDEMRVLKNAGYSLKDHGIQTLGAREFFEYFNGDKTYESVAEEILKQTKAYAKRQRTWARTQYNADVVLTESSDGLKEILEAFNA